MKKNQTKDRITDTLASMIITQNVDKITITDLVNNCDVSRQTFYYHFQDISDALDWMIVRIVNRILESSFDASDLNESINRFILSCQEYRKPISALLSSQKRAYLENSLINALKEALKRRFKDFHIKYNIPEDTVDMLFSFFTYGIVGFIFDNKANFFEDTNKSSKFVYTLISKSIEALNYSSF